MNKKEDNDLKKNDDAVSVPDPGRASIEEPEIEPDSSNDACMPEEHDGVQHSGSEAEISDDPAATDKKNAESELRSLNLKPIDNKILIFAGIAAVLVISVVLLVWNDRKVSQIKAVNRAKYQRYMELKRKEQGQGLAFMARWSKRYEDDKMDPEELIPAKK